MKGKFFVIVIISMLASFLGYAAAQSITTTGPGEPKASTPWVSIPHRNLETRSLGEQGEEGELLPVAGGLTMAQKAQLLKVYKKFIKKSTAEQQRLRDNWQRFKSLSVQDRDRIRMRFALWQKLSVSDQEWLQQQKQRFENLSTEKQELVGERYRHWQQLSSGERQEIRQRFQAQRQNSQD